MYKDLENIIRGAIGRRWQGIGGAARVALSAASVAAVTPSDTTVLANILFVTVTGAGNLAIVMPDGTTATFAVAANSKWDISPSKIMATGTTATGMVAFMA